MLEELFDTPIGRIAGGLSALAGAVFFYRASYRVFEWMFTTRVWEFFGWLVTIAFAAVLLWLSTKLWSRWRLVFGATLAFLILWSMVRTIPQINESVARLKNDRFGFVQTTTIYANAIVLLPVAVVSLFADRILAWWKPRIEQHRNSASRGRVQWPRARSPLPLRRSVPGASGGHGAGAQGAEGAHREDPEVGGEGGGEEEVERTPWRTWPR